MQEKGGPGFPYLVVMDAEGEVIAPPDSRTVESFTKVVSAATGYGVLKNRYESGDKQAAAGYLEAGLDLGILPAETARKIFAGLEGLKADEIAELNNKIAAVEFGIVLESVNSSESAVAAGETFLEMLASGFVPEGMQATNLWAMVSYYAEAQEDAELLARAINEFKQAASSSRYRNTNLERMESALENLKN